MGRKGSVLTREALIKPSVGEALWFARQHWRFALTVAGAGAFMLLATAVLLGATPFGIAGVVFVSTAIHAFLVRAALTGPASVRATPWRDTLRALAAIVMVGCFSLIVTFMVTYVTMSILIAPFVDEAKAAGENAEAMAKVMRQAVAAQPNVVTWGAAALAMLILLLTSRFYLAVPASVEHGRVVVFESWKWTKGNLLRIVAARLWLLAPAMAFVFAIQSLLGIAVGVNAADPFSWARSAQTNQLGFLVFYLGAQFVQIAVYSTLEAGLATALYGRLKREIAPRRV